MRGRRGLVRQEANGGAAGGWGTAIQPVAGRPIHAAGGESLWNALHGLTFFDQADLRNHALGRQGAGKQRKQGAEKGGGTHLGEG